MSLDGKKILLIISGSIAAPKILLVMKVLREKKAEVTTLLTRRGAEFVTPEQVKEHSGKAPFVGLFAKDADAAGGEEDMDHIYHSRRNDLVVVAPASADIIAKMAQGFADDLASTTLLASNKPVILVPAMNPEMWAKPSTQRNLQILLEDGVRVVGPVKGLTACGEDGLGRMVEAETIVQEIERFFAPKALAGMRALVTAGPTREAIDPVRFISNASSGKQGYAVARALAEEGAEVTLISGPVALAPPQGVTLIKVNAASEMLQAAEKALPVDIAVCAAAVADWRVAEPSPAKIKKGFGMPTLRFAENPDILATIAQKKTNRPRLVVGFAAETEDMESNARVKLMKKGCDWIVANDVSAGVIGEDENEVMLFTQNQGHIQKDAWPRLSKNQVAQRLVARIVEEFSKGG
jgi:phosphopantothenoylcysteine decarboxylase/phosphopantothenate--cysteine ligase